MTIRKQLTLFIAAIFILPVLSVSLVFAYFSYSSAEHVLLRGSRRLKNIQNLELSETDWRLLHEAIKYVPKEREVCLVANSTVVSSSFPEIKNWTRITEAQIWEHIRETSADYSYQIETPPLGTKNQRVLLISRVNKDNRSKKRHTFMLALDLYTVFIALCITIVIFISKSVFSSIKILEAQTKKIADGDLDAKIEIKEKGKNEITSLTESLEKMRLSLKDAQARRARFVMGISHDLRTPIAVIKGYTEAMNDGIIEEEKEQKEALDTILSKTSQLESMVDTLISYEKLSTDEWKNRMEEVNLGDFLLQFAKNSAATGTVFKRNVFYSIKVPENTKVMMNTQFVQRALDNIFSNAMRYTKDNDTISISAGVSEEKDSIDISIADTGRGIKEKDIKNIFDLFFRGTESRREEGMGIGLSVVKNIIDTHGWKINVKSKFGEGTEFIINIPVTPPITNKFASLNAEKISSRRKKNSVFKK